MPLLIYPLLGTPQGEQTFVFRNQRIKTVSAWPSPAPYSDWSNNSLKYSLHTQQDFTINEVQIESVSIEKRDLNLLMKTWWLSFPLRI